MAASIAAASELERPSRCDVRCGGAEKVDGDEADLVVQVELVEVAFMHDELHELALRLDIDALELTGLVLASLIVVKRQVAKARPLTVEIVVSESREQLNSRGNLALVRQDLHLRDCRESIQLLIYSTKRLDCYPQCESFHGLPKILKHLDTEPLHLFRRNIKYHLPKYPIESTSRLFHHRS